MCMFKNSIELRCKICVCFKNSIGIRCKICVCLRIV